MREAMSSRLRAGGSSLFPFVSGCHDAGAQPGSPLVRKDWAEKWALYSTKENFDTGGIPVRYPFGYKRGDDSQRRSSTMSALLSNSAYAGST